MSKVAVYVRVSTVGQNLDGQRASVQGWLDGHGVKDAVWYEDAGVSGDTLNRPAMDQLKADIFSGKVKTVVCFKLDRLSRSMQDGINLLTDWLKSGVRVVSVTQQLDFSGTVGQMVAAVLLAVAQMEQETRRERQAVGIAVAKREGKYKGRQAGTTNKSSEPRERILELIDKGLTHAEIATALGCSTKTIQRAIKQPA